jgi:hypothetical protein
LSSSGLAEEGSKDSSASPLKDTLSTTEGRISEQERSTDRDESSQPPNDPSQPSWADQELAVQLRMADLTERGLRYTKSQFWLSLVGIAGLLTTLLFTAIATRAASKAASAAADSLPLQGRGHLGVSKFTFHRATR